MKRFLTVLTLALLFVGCSEESNESPPTLLSKWYYSTVTVNGVTSAATVVGCDRSFIEFTENLFQNTIHSKNEENECAVISSISNYEVINLQIHDDSTSSPIYEITSLSEDELVLHYLQTADIDGDGEIEDVIYTFSRI